MYKLQYQHWKDIHKQLTSLNDPTDSKNSNQCSQAEGTLAAIESKP